MSEDNSVNPAVAFVAGYNQITNILQKNEIVDLECENNTLRKRHGYAIDELKCKIDALKLQVTEARELAHAWEERAVVLEAKKDSWLTVIRNLLTRGEITITKDEVNKRYTESYDVLVETNLETMRSKHNPG